MNKITIILKTGRELNFECDEISLERNKLSNEIVSYNIKGIKKGEFPISLNPSDIYCVTQTYDEKEAENG